MDTSNGRIEAATVLQIYFLLHIMDVNLSEQGYINTRQAYTEMCR